MMVELIFEDDRWQGAGLASLAERAVAATLTHQGLDPSAWEIALLACDDARIAALNADHRGKPAPTNVLSWPEADLAAETPGARPTPPETGAQGPGEGFLGDIAISYDTSAREAAEQGKPLGDHVTHLLVHAVLHLLGYDHMRDADAALMERIEVEILGKLGIADPY